MLQCSLKTVSGGSKSEDLNQMWIQTWMLKQMLQERHASLAFFAFEGEGPHFRFEVVESGIGHAAMQQNKAQQVRPRKMDGKPIGKGDQGDIGYGEHQAGLEMGVAQIDQDMVDMVSVRQENLLSGKLSGDHDPERVKNRDAQDYQQQSGEIFGQDAQAKYFRRTHRQHFQGKESDQKADKQGSCVSHKYFSTDRSGKIESGECQEGADQKHTDQKEIFHPDLQKHSPQGT